VDNPFLISIPTCPESAITRVSLEDASSRAPSAAATRSIRCPLLRERVSSAEGRGGMEIMTLRTFFLSPRAIRARERKSETELRERRVHRACNRSASGMRGGGREEGKTGWETGEGIRSSGCGAFRSWMPRGEARQRSAARCSAVQRVAIALSLSLSLSSHRHRRPQPQPPPPPILLIYGRTINHRSVHRMFRN